MTLFLKRHFHFQAVLAFTLFVSGCSKQTEPPIPPDLFSNIYSRLMLISESIAVTSDSLSKVKQSKIDSLFLEYRTTEQAFRATVAYYQQRPEQWTEILHQASLCLDSLRSQISRAKR